MRTRVDRGRTFLPLCECGWRGLPALTHEEALRQARHHEQRAHPGHIHARDALDSWRKRHAHDSSSVPHPGA
nr:hypothetical protein [Actinomyces sp.]